MSDKRQELPQLSTPNSVSFSVGLILTAIVLLALPISQLITEFTEKANREIDVVEMKPPELPDTPPPPPEEEQEEEIEDIEESREPPTLAELEIAMNTDLSGLASGDFTVPAFDIAGQMEEIIYELQDLTRPPRPTSRRQPVYPPELRRMRVSGEVTLKFVVTSEGKTTRISVEESSHPGFEEPSKRAVRTWRFQPGEKDGKAVSVWVRQKIPFNLQ